ncbi:GEVED domain-containing protein [Hymenobacter profundi]|uniref:T9SS type A sorting domain-containing protein n=1 Tax=Hymenobacter profundi TaxID=1982110 RepID=A0ABS6X3K5_9BACT|nr:GEVED domain-containing protein [Hymenobacter profundi]MBW3130416.1 T9SS type A sorting domain-containing protein [Hymenobacter profundi]
MKNIYCVLILLLFGGLWVPAYGQKPLYLGKLKEVAAQYKKPVQAAVSAKGGGAAVRQALPEGKALALTLTASKRQGAAELFFGEVTSTKHSTFYLKVSDREATGSVILRDEKKYYRFSSTADGSVFLTEEDIDKVLCVGYQDRENIAPATQSTTSVTVAAAVPALESLPGAGAVLYLDFDGQTVTNTLWNYNFNDGNPIEAAPATLSEREMTEVWKLVSEDYRPFALNVTTSEAVFNQAPANRRMRVIFTPTTDFYPGAGGVAYIGSFAWGGTSYGETPCWVFNGGVKGAGEAGSHEGGHTLYLGHDGRTTPAEGYFAGQQSWAPIMGVGYYVPVAQWSKGEYPYANNMEDDLLKISTMNGFGYRADDHGNDLASATPLVVGAGGVVSGAANQGVISTTTDVDVFSIKHAGGPLALSVRPDPAHPNLDVLLTLRDAAGTVVATADPATLSASLEGTWPAGVYYLTIDGTVGALGANSDYASLGAYSIATKDYEQPTYADGCTNYATLINNFSFSTLANANSGCGGGTANGYTIYPPTGTLTTTLTRGESYAMQMQAANYSMYFGVWIDFNQDKDFDDEGEFVYASPTSSTSPFATTIAIPATARLGTTRMRVRSTYSPQITSGQSSSSMTYGEAEDYTITIRANEAPVVRLTSPVPGASFSAPATISLTADATDADGRVAKVEFFAGTTKLGEVLTAPYTYTWSGVGAGTYALTAVATDDKGLAATSAVVSVTVNDNAVAQGCGLGYWKNHPDRWGCYTPTTLYRSIFQSAPAELKTKTLLEVLKSGGGGNYNLGRQSVAALQNICSSTVGYGAPYRGDTQKLINDVNAAFTSKDKKAANALADKLEKLNSAGCPLDGNSAKLLATATSSAQHLTDEVGGMNKQLNIYPNPFTEEAVIEFQQAQTQNYVLELYDVTGRLLQRIAAGTAEAGRNYQFPVDSRNLAEGMYLVRLTTGETAQSFRLLKAK